MYNYVKDCEIYTRLDVILQLMEANSSKEDEYFLGIYNRNPELEEWAKRQGYSFKINGKGFATFKLIEKN